MKHDIWVTDTVNGHGHVIFEGKGGKRNEKDSNFRNRVVPSA